MEAGLYTEDSDLFKSVLTLVSFLDFVSDHIVRFFSSKNMVMTNVDNCQRVLQNIVCFSLRNI